jgi:putative DNA primase/helicase
MNVERFLAKFEKELRLHNGEFYYYKDGKHILISNEELSREVYAYLGNGEADDKINFDTIARVTKTIRLAIPVVKKSSPHYLPNPDDASLYIPLKDKHLKIKIYNKYVSITPRDHTPDFFCKYKLSFNFDENAGCKTFISFLKSILPEEDIKLLQEWMGYLLIPSNHAQKMMFLYGIGANGKSVLCLIITLLLGEENVSHCSIDAFLPQGKFRLAETSEKLANISEEIDEMDSIPTGQLKQYIGGSPIMFEKKYKSPKKDFPTARLIFATNTLPSFKDSSDGMWRRVLIIWFKKQFLNARQQDKRLSQKEFWIESGELPGIFNWALKGLKRLIENDWCFSEHTDMKKILENYKSDNSPMELFVSDYTVIGDSNRVSSRKLYKEFCEFQKTYGYRPINHGEFSKSLRRMFPSLEITPNAHFIKGEGRSRYWIGIKLKSENLSKDASTESSTLMTQEKQ